MRNGRSKVSWEDHKGNRHDLDYVLEAGGTEATVGCPKAFIEIAYRRYTKHSRNKAQEIQSAISPLFDTYAHDHPFIGVVLAGVFTEGSLTQLRSHGFSVLYMPFDSIVRAFEIVGIDAYFDEDSEDADVQKKVDAWNVLPERSRIKVGDKLRRIHSDDFTRFVRELENCLTRSITSVCVLTLHGQTKELASVKSAIAFIESFEETTVAGAFVRYEVNVRYSNGDEIRGSFETKADALRFLRSGA